MPQILPDMATRLRLDVAFDDFQVTNDRPRRHRW
jgi:hypothetical protein